VLFLAKLKKIDWSIILILLILMAISTMLIHSATISNEKLYKLGLPKKSLIFYAIGFVVMLGTAFFDYRLLLKMSLYLYGFGILLLIGLFTPLGTEHFGAKGWYTLPLGSLEFQPAELMKLILILAIAWFLARREGEKLELKRDVLPVGFMVFIPFVLILVQPDLGNGVILLVILLALYWIGNIKFLHVLLGTVLVGVLLSSFFYLFVHFNKPITEYADKYGVSHWVDRLNTFIDPSLAKDKKKAEANMYQTENSKIAIGSGSLTGQGYLQGKSLHSNHIPVAYTDSIFVVVGEEFGFRGGAVLLVLYFILIYRMIMIAMEATDLGGSYVIVGILSMYVFQIFENIGMLIGLMPLTGITLPFLSYGGTSLLINMLAIGLVMSIRVHQDAPSEY
jgi:rod shape determining protein RodA